MRRFGKRENFKKNSHKNINKKNRGFYGGFTRTICKVLCKETNQGKTLTTYALALWEPIAETLQRGFSVTSEGIMSQLNTQDHKRKESDSYVEEKEST